MMSHKVLWNDCLELEAYIRSKTAQYTFELYGMNPEINMSGETSVITTFCVFEWYHVGNKGKPLYYHRGDSVVVFQYHRDDVVQ